MTLKGNIQWLLDHGYCVVVNNQIVFTKKVNEEFKGSKFKFAIEQIQTPAEVVKEITSDPKAVWNQFIMDAEIPHRVKAPDGGIYTVRQYSPANAKRLISLIHNPKIDYNRLVESTKNYYKTVTYKHLLSNYIEKGLWQHEYDAWTGVKETRLNSGENPFED